MNELKIQNVQLMKDGPILLKVNENNLALCRCGQSQNIPNCDGSHKKCEYKAEGKTLKDLIQVV